MKNSIQTNFRLPLSIPRLLHNLNKNHSKFILFNRKQILARELYLYLLFCLYTYFTLFSNLQNTRRTHTSIRTRAYAIYTLEAHVHVINKQTNYVTKFYLF